MKPQTQTVDKQAKAQGRKIKMTFDQSALAHLQNIFIDLYADPINATVREILSNARDAHVRAGVTRPVEVSLPGFGEEFIVTDHGDGMDPQTFEENYSRYGASTKRDNNEELGMLGLGAKAPLSLVDQFTITTIGGGIKTVAVVSRGADGTGEIDVLVEDETDEPSGTQVRIPVSGDTTEFNRRVREFVRFWDSDWVRIDGQEPESIDGFRVDPDILLTKDTYDDYVVMGGVPYRVGRQHKMGSYYTHLVVNVPIGAVDISPSREELRYTDRTIEVLDAAREFAREAVTRQAQAAVDAQDSKADAIHHFYTEVMSNLDSQLIDGRPTYKGEALPSDFNVGGVRMQRYDVSADERTVLEYEVVSYSDLHDQVIVPDYDNKTLSRTNKDKTKKVLDQQGLRPRYVYFYEATDVTTEGWLDKVATLSWTDQIKPTKIERAYTGGGNRVSAGTYEVVVGASYGSVYTKTVDAEELVGCKMAYFSPSTDISNVSRLHTTMVNNGYTLVQLGKNRWNKFEREYDDAAHVPDVLADLAREVTDQMDGTEAQWNDAVDYNTGWFTDLLEDRDQIKDADLKAALDSYEDSRGLLREYNEFKRCYTSLERHWAHSFPSLPTQDGEGSVTTFNINQFNDRYPLLNSRRNKAADMVEYINAMVAYRESEVDSALTS